MKHLRFGFICMMVFMMTAAGLAEASKVEIEKVEIKYIQGERTVNTNLENRVIASIQAVGDKLLLGRKAEDVEEHKKRFEDTIRQVFDRVLYGYEISDVVIIPGKTTTINLRMVPWGDTVQSTKVQIDTGALKEADQALIRQDLAGIEERVAQILIGLPVDAFAWADSVSRAMIREIIIERLPEFRAEIEYIPDSNTTVTIRLQPIGPVIRRTSVTLRSESLPKVLLLSVNRSAEKAAEKLEGLPVAFVQRHKKVYVGRLQQETEAHKVVKKFGLSVSCDYNLGERTEGEIQAESLKYRINFEEIVDLGHHGSDNTTLKSHVGYLVMPQTELFVDTQFYPNSISWHIQPGLGQQLTRKTYAGIKHDITENENIFIFKHRLADNLMFNIERNLTSGQKITGIRYRIHEFLSAEAMYDGKNIWARVIGGL